MKELIRKVVDGNDLSREEAREVMATIMEGHATPAQIASILTALRIKGETITEISEFALVMREHAESIHPKVKGTLVDTCGTGGDRLNTFNISTISAFVTSGAGVPIAKHGNRSVSSKSGSADLLEALEVKVDIAPEKVEGIIEKIGIGFMFAPVFHGAMKYAIGPRREMGIRTVFNVLGPLTNPANASAQVLGVFNPELTETIGGVLIELGVKRALVVHGLDGLDEISNIGVTQITEIKKGTLETYRLEPGDLGIEVAHASDISGGDPVENAIISTNILKGKEPGPKEDIVAMNAGAAIYVGGKADSMAQGIEKARESISSGNAFEKLLNLSIESKIHG